MWLYDAGDSAISKHYWNNDFAGVIEVSGHKVSKCPKSITKQKAQQLLNAGYEWKKPRSKQAHPDRIYSVYKGIVYRAVPTIPGKSYHGFPELKGQLPPDPRLRQELIKMARTDGTERGVKRWLKKQ